MNQESATLIVLPPIENSRPTTLPVLRPVMPELDAVRGIAILAVLFYHGFYWAIDLSRFAPAKKLFLTLMWVGRLGVNLFFVLSGFLITMLLVNSRNRHDYYRRFYLRRILRIVPPYLLTLATLSVARAAPLNFVLLSLVYLSNLTPLFGIPVAYSVLWSLAVEEHFYLVWPAIVRNISNRARITTCLLVIAASPFSRLLSFYIAQRHGWVSYKIFDYTWNSADGLACGALLSICLMDFSLSRTALWKIAATLSLLATAIWIAALPFGILSQHKPIGAALQMVPLNFIFVALLIAVLLLGSGPYRQWSRSPVLEFFGYISYGLYLYHLMVFNAFQWVLANGLIKNLDMDPFWALVIRFLAVGSLSVAIAYLSRKYFEDPFLRLKARFA
jgi:peptidoglycan/LPS O-acetylase OafA/YrhL